MWTSAENFENDLIIFSEIEAVRDNRVTTIPQSILEWEARKGINQHRSVFDTPDLSEDVTYVFSGRGRGGISTIIKPGVATKDTTNMEDDIKKKIRQVAGPGFSNELIEQSFRHGSGNTITGAVNPELKFLPAMSPKRNKSNQSTPNTTSRISTPNDSSGRSSPIASSSRSPPMSRCSSRVSISPEPAPKVVLEEPNSNPMPLSAILRKARDVRKKAIETPKVIEKENEEVVTEGNIQANVDQNDVWWNGTSSDTGSEEYSWRRRDISIPNRFFTDCVKSKGSSRNFNIGSTNDFPALK